MIPPMIPLTSDSPRLRQPHVSRSPVARRHANAVPTKAAQIPMALRHHERTLATFTPTLRGSFPYYFCTTNWPLLSPAPKRSFPYYICTTNWPLLSPSLKGSFPYDICPTNWPLLSPAPKSSFPYYFCTTNWPLLSPAPKSFFPHYICTTNWPGLSPAPQVQRQDQRAFRVRLPPKVQGPVSKTSASYETPSKSEAPSLQNARFVRDFLQKSSAKSPKRAFRTRLPPK